MVGGKIPPGAEREGPFAGFRAKSPAQRHCRGIAEGLCLSAASSSAWLYDQTPCPSTFCSQMVLIVVKSSPGKKKKGHGSPGSQLKNSLFTVIIP